MRSAQVWPAVFLVALGANAGSRQAEKSAMAPLSPHTMGTKRTVKGIPNFGQVTPNLYRGAQPSAEGIAELKNMGVEVIVDLRGGGRSEEAAAKKLGMQYVSIPSHCPFPRDEPFAKFLKVIEENPGKKVFVHCRLGDDRTGMAVAAYRMAEEGWQPDEALREMKAFGFSTLHRAICPGLESYEQGFRKRLKEDSAFRDLPSRNQPASR
jgi:protein tyrosine/serine phosphatase